MRAAWAPFAALCLLAVGRVVTSSVPQPAPLGDDAQQHEAFRFVASDEMAERRESSKVFPTDLWSRDDDFHQRELSRARDWARTHHAPLQEVLAAVDEGLREHWPYGSSAPLVATVPPCRPRAIY